MINNIIGNTSCRKICYKLVLLIVSSFFAYLVYSETKPAAKTNNNFKVNKYGENDTSIRNDVRYDLRIIVLAFNRAASLLRLLKSVNTAEFGNDKVILEVWIDRSDQGRIDHSTCKTARTFTFLHGDYKINIHPKKVGLMGQWLLAWTPESGSKEIAVILEDDLTVSKYFYRYLKAVHQKYDHRPDVNGYTLQASQITFDMKTNGNVECPANHTLYLYPVLGSWGFSPNNKNWNHFLEWYSSSNGHRKTKPYLPGHKATLWYKAFEKNGRSDTMWTIWHIYHAWKYNEFTMYYKFKGNRGLATNWREKGLHYKKNIGPTNALLTEWTTEYGRDLPDNLLFIDVAGKIPN